MLEEKYTNERSLKNYMYLIISLIIGSIFLILIFLLKVENFTLQDNDLNIILMSFCLTLFIFLINVIAFSLYSKTFMHATPFVLLSIFFANNILISTDRILTLIFLTVLTTLFVFLCYYFCIKKYVSYTARNFTHALKIMREKMYASFFIIGFLSSLMSIFIIIFGIIFRKGELFMIIILPIFIFTFTVVTYMLYVFGANITFFHMLSGLGDSKNILKNTFLSVGTAITASLCYIFIDFYKNYGYIRISNINFYYFFAYNSVINYIADELFELSNPYVFYMMALTGNNFYKCLVESFMEIYSENEIRAYRNNSIIITLLFSNLSIFLLFNLYFKFSKPFIIGSLCGLMFTLSISFVIDAIEKSLLVLYVTDRELFKK